MGEMGHGPCDKQGDGFGWLRRAPSANFPRSSRGRRKAYFQSGSRVIEGSLTGGREEQGIECGTRLRTQAEIRKGFGEIGHRAKQRFAMSPKVTYPGGVHTTEEEDRGVAPGGFLEEASS